MGAGLLVFTLFHVALSLVGILAGFVVVYSLAVGSLDRGLLLDHRPDERHRVLFPLS